VHQGLTPATALVSRDQALQVCLTPEAQRLIPGNITARYQNSRHAPVELENYGPTHPKKKKKKKKQIKSKSNKFLETITERIIYGK